MLGNLYSARPPTSVHTELDKISKPQLLRSILFETLELNVVWTVICKLKLAIIYQTSQKTITWRQG